MGAALYGISALLISGFLVGAARRLAYPFEIEWIESELLQHAARARHGLSLYAEPTAEFAPTIYPPLYAWLSGLASWLVGPGFAAPRLVSVASSLALAWLAGRAASRLSGFPLIAVPTAALVLGSSVACGTVLDLARVDALWVALLLGATALAERAERSELARYPALAGLAFALATAAKQPAILFAGATLVPLALRSRPRAALFAAAWLAPTALFHGLLHLATGGWSTRYLFLIPLKVPHRPSALLHLLRDDLVGNFAPAVCLLACWAVLPRALVPAGRLPLTWVAASLAAGFSTLSMRTLQGGAENTLLAGVAFGAVLTGGLAGRVIRHGGPVARAAVMVGLSVQLLRFLVSPLNLVPPPEERARAQRLVGRIRGLDGEVWIPSHTSYAHLAGKPWLVHRDPLLDMLYSGTGKPPADLVAALRQGRYGAVIADSPFAEPEIQQALEEGYRLETTFEDGPTPLVGYRTRPRLLYLPRAGSGR